MASLPSIRNVSCAFSLARSALSWSSLTVGRIRSDETTHEIDELSNPDFRSCSGFVSNNCWIASKALYRWASLAFARQRIILSLNRIRVRVASIQFLAPECCSWYAPSFPAGTAAGELKDEEDPHCLTASLIYWRVVGAIGLYGCLLVWTFSLLICSR